MAQQESDISQRHQVGDILTTQRKIWRGPKLETTDTWYMDTWASWAQNALNKHARYSRGRPTEGLSEKYSVCLPQPTGQSHRGYGEFSLSHVQEPLQPFILYTLFLPIPRNILIKKNSFHHTLSLKMLLTNLDLNTVISNLSGTLPTPPLTCSGQINFCCVMIKEKLLLWNKEILTRIWPPWNTSKSY